MPEEYPELRGTAQAGEKRLPGTINHKEIYMNIEIARINQGIEKDPKEYVRTINEDYIYKLSKIADDIAENRNEKPVVLLSGPSGSVLELLVLCQVEIDMHDICFRNICFHIPFERFQQL